jgi:hypothetical protein
MMALGGGYAGVVFGSVEDVAGVSGNINVAVGGVQVSFLFNNSGFMGVTAGLGGPPLPFPEASGVMTHTGIAALNRCK